VSDKTDEERLAELNERKDALKEKLEKVREKTIAIASKDTKKVCTSAFMDAVVLVMVGKVAGPAVLAGALLGLVVFREAGAFVMRWHLRRKLEVPEA
jgi:hypothetical protein